MRYIIATDEAGYGPNLGPLVIGATVWQILDDMPVEEMPERLAPVIVATPGQADDSTIAVGDSKAIYSGAIRHLERSVLACAAASRSACCETSLGTWREFFTRLDPHVETQLDDMPWHKDFNVPLPLEASEAEIPPLAQKLCATLETSGIRLINMSARVVFPKLFNKMLDTVDNKSTILSDITLSLVNEKLMQLPAKAPVEILCDKHGGRDYYQPLLMTHLPGGMPQTLQESRELGRYRIEGERTIDISFRMKAESLLPVALSSMTAKYLRELAMTALNKFWTERIENLKPTAGYPVDAKRFLAEIAEEVETLGIARDDFWRKK